MKKIKLTESDLYRIVRKVLLEQEEEKRSFTFSPGSFESIITSSSGEGFVKFLNNKYDEIIIDGNLSLRKTPIQTLPNNLHVRGYLDLYGCKNLKSLPDNLYVKDYLYLRKSSIESLSDNFKIGTDLDLALTPIQYLPDNLRVEEDLDLEGTPIQSLPDNLYVGGNLYLNDCKNLKSLPDNLDVKGVIHISGTVLDYDDELVDQYKRKYTIN